MISFNDIRQPTQLQQGQSIGECKRTVFESSLRGMRELESIAMFCDVMVTPYHDDSELERTYQQAHQSALNHSLELLSVQRIEDWLETNPLSAEQEAELSIKLVEIASGIDAIEYELSGVCRSADRSTPGTAASVVLQAQSDAYRVALSFQAFAHLRNRSPSSPMVDHH